MPEDINLSEACDELVKIIQAGNEYPESYALMLMTFTNEIDAGETSRMALALAKKAIAA